MSIRSFKRAQARRIARERRRATVLARRGALVAGTALTSATLFAAGAQAATYTVTTTGDANNGTAGCSGTYQCDSLRDAITTANGNGQFTNTINFASGLNGTIPLINGEMAITGGALTINGPGAGTLAIDAQGASRIFDVQSVSNENQRPVSITGLTMENGNSQTDNYGGAIYNDTFSRPLNLGSDTIKNSTTPNESGGGIFSSAPLTIADSTLSGDTAPGRDGGAIYAEGIYPAVISNTVISGNSAYYGGGIYSKAPLSVSSSQVTGNHATSTSGGGEGGGLYIKPKYGAIINGTVISGNTAGYGGGGAVISPRGKYSGYSPLTLENSTVSGNQAPTGAGVLVTGGSGNVEIAASTISGNQGTGTTSYGGGLAIPGDITGKVALSDSTISGNSATDGAAVSLGGAGYNDPLNPYTKTTPPGKIEFGNSTISGNTASLHGGGIFLGEYTKSGSSAELSGTANLDSTIVSGNKDSSGANDLYRVPQSTTGGFNGAFSLVQNPGNAPFVSQNQMILGRDPQLGPLANNGGPTQTMLPSSTSPVIDQGHAATGLTTDQRGDPRTVDTGVPNPPGGDGTDIGSVELAVNQVFVSPAASAGFTVTLRGTPLGPKTNPLLVDAQTPVSCTVRTGVLQTCLIEVYKGKTLLARGQATNPVGSKTLGLKTHVTKAGLYNYKHHPLGQNVTVVAIGDPNVPGTRVLTGHAHLLALPKITLPLPVRTATLSAQERSNLRTVVRLLKGVKHTTCTAYTDKPVNDNPSQDLSLTRAQAKAACVRMKKDGLTGTTRFVGRGTVKPLETNKTQRGRLANRRVVITWSF